MTGRVLYAAALAAAAIVTASVYAQANEGAVGNGGTAVVCRNSQGGIEGAELLDLYEAHTFRGIEIYRAGNGDRAAYLARALERLKLDRVLLADTLAYIEEIMGRGRDVKSTYLYKPQAIREVLPRLSQPGCKFEVVINYLADYDVRVNRPVYNALPAVDQAALGVHEALFRIARERAHVLNSLTVRPLVAALFATHADPKALAKIVGKPFREAVREVSLYAGAGASLTAMFTAGISMGRPDHFSKEARCKAFVYEPATENRVEIGHWHFATWTGTYSTFWTLPLALGNTVTLAGKTVALECHVDSEVGADVTFKQNRARVAGGFFRRAINPWVFGDVQRARFHITVLPGEPPKGRQGD